MKVYIRSAVESDLVSILNIINYEIENSTSLYDYSPRTYSDQLEWFEKKEKDGMPITIVDYDGKVAGFATFGIFRPWDAYQYSVEHSIYINKDYRGLGLGKLLLHDLILKAKQDGYHTMIAGIDASNIQSFKFHQNFGFVEIGVFREIGFKFGKWLDLKFMQLFLERYSKEDVSK